MNFKKISILTVFFLCLMIVASSIEGTSIPKSYIFSLDKLIHFVEYFLLGILLICLFSDFSKYPIAAGFTAGVFYSFIDELYQSTVFGRSSSILDVFADIVGLIFSIIIVKISFKSHRYD